MQPLITATIAMLVITILLLVFGTIVETVMNMLWTLVMMSYSLSLPAFLWGGGAFSFPSFLPTSANSPMNFYYWFFLVAVLTMLVFFAFNAFRHLSIWGKFDETVTYEQTNFWHQFKWVLFLGFMTFLTPIIIWAVYSVFMLGAYFFMNMIDKRAMFLSITKNEYNELKKTMLSYLSQFTGESFTQKGEEVAAIFTKMGSDAGFSKIKEYLVAQNAGYTDAQLAQMKFNFNQLAQMIPGKFSTIKTAATDFQKIVNAAEYGKGMDSTGLTTFIDKINNVLSANTLEDANSPIDSTTLCTKYNFWYMWSSYFGNSISNKANFGALAKAAYGEQYSSIEAFVNQWENGTSGSIFHLIGYGYNGAPTTAANNVTPLIKYLTAQADITMKVDNYSGTFSISFLNFVDGSEEGLKTCPLIKYVNSSIGNTSYGKFYAMGAGVVMGQTAALAGEICGSLMIDTEVWGTSFAAAGYAVGYAAFALGLVTFIPFLLKALIFCFAALALCKPLAGFTMFVWASFFESFWYFLLLLPAIGATINDSDHTKGIYSKAWRNCMGKMASTLLLWMGLVMMFAALFKLEDFYNMIMYNTPLTKDWSNLYIDITIDLSTITKGFNEIQNVVSKIKLHIPSIIQLFIVCVILSSVQSFIPQVGGSIFGQDVFDRSAQILAQPVAALAPSFASSFSTIAGVGKAGIGKIGGAVGQSVGGMGQSIRDNKDQGQKSDAKNAETRSNMQAAAKSAPSFSQSGKNVGARVDKYNSGGYKSAEGQANVENTFWKANDMQKANMWNSLSADKQKEFRKTYVKNHTGRGGDFTNRKAANKSFDAMVGLSKK